MRYSQEELDALVNCQKRVTDPPRREMKAENGYFRSDFRLESLDGERQFVGFLRQSAAFPENFSVGLDYQPKDEGRFPLLRLNGKHGDANFSFDPAHPHNDTHLHRITAEDLEAGIIRARHATTCGEYASFEEAVGYFVKLLSTVDDGGCFDRFRQLNLNLQEPGS
jgi:hypothetical protein